MENYEQLLIDLQSEDKNIRAKAANQLGKIDRGQEQIVARIIDELDKTAENDSYKLARDIAKKSILKFTNPDYFEEPSTQYTPSQPNQKSNTDEHQYPAMKTLGAFYGLLGWVVLIFSVLAGIIGAASLFESNFGLAIIVFLGLPIFGAILALPMMAAGDFFALLINQAKDVRFIKSELNK